MTKFERYHIQDPPREREEKREKSPEDYYATSTEFIYKPPWIEKFDESTITGKKYKLAKEICENTQVIDTNEKSKSKIPKRKSKKNSTKAH